MTGEGPPTGIEPENDGPGNEAYQRMRDLEAEVRARALGRG